VDLIISVPRWTFSTGPASSTRGLLAIPTTNAAFALLKHAAEHNRDRSLNLILFPTACAQNHVILTISARENDTRRLISSAITTKISSKRWTLDCISFIDSPNLLIDESSYTATLLFVLYFSSISLFKTKAML
jgi:hypothetical protein